MRLYINLFFVSPIVLFIISITSLSLSAPPAEANQNEGQILAINMLLSHLHRHLRRRRRPISARNSLSSIKIRILRHQLQQLLRFPNKLQQQQQHSIQSLSPHPPLRPLPPKTHPLPPQPLRQPRRRPPHLPHPHRRAHIHFLALLNHLIYAASGDRINVYETITNTHVDTFNDDATSTGAAKSIAFRGGRIFTAHQDCKIRVWKLNDQKKHKLIATLPTLEDRLRRFILPHNYVKVRRHKQRLWIEHHDAVSGLAATAEAGDNLVTSISWDRSIKIWNARNLHCLQSINKAHDDAINAVAVSIDGLIYTGSADRKIKVWKREDPNSKYAAIATLEKHKSAVNALALSRDGSVLFSGSCDRSILVWEREGSAAHMAVAGALRGHAKAILCLINVSDLLMSGSADRTVRIWRRGFDGRFCCLAVLEGHRTPVRSLAAAEVGGSGGAKVFSGSFDGEIRVWEVDVSGVKGFDTTVNFLNV